MNELLLIVSAVVSALFVLVALKFGKERLYGAIIVFLILIASMGGKIVEFAGHQTNTGNIFYASIFLATYFLIERHGKKEGLYSIWIGAIWILFFAAFVQITVALTGTPDSQAVSDAQRIAFSSVPRVALASIVSYILSQSLNVYLYLWLRKKMDGKRLWLRANISNAAAQGLDSVIFFVVAFGGAVIPDNLSDIIITGFVLKVLYMMGAALLLYLNSIEEDREPESSSITYRYDR